jgi:acid phosphatase (class A)
MIAETSCEKISGEFVVAGPAAIFKRAAIFGHNRVVAGVHYPTDIEAGRIAGSVIDNVFLHQPGFMADFAKARAEVRLILGLP